MSNEGPSEGTTTAEAPPFALFWCDGAATTPSEPLGTLVIWPLAERRPAGVVARFVVVEDEQRRTYLIAPMDLGGEPFVADARPATAADDVGTLPLVLRLPKRANLRVTIHYLVAQWDDGAVRLETDSRLSFVVGEPLCERANDEVVDLRPFVFGRLRDSDGPARPIAVTGFPQVSCRDLDKRFSQPADVGDVDWLVHACEQRGGAGGAEFDVRFILLLPSIGGQRIGAARPILPYGNARFHASTEIISASDNDDSAEVPTSYPRLRLRIGSSRYARDVLTSDIEFFHWNRTAASPRSDELFGDTAGAAEPLALYRGETQARDLICDFKDVGFGDVVGVIIGLSGQVQPVFAEWPQRQALIPDLQPGLSVAAFLWVGDELAPFRYAEGSSPLQAMTGAVMEQLADALQRLAGTRPAQRADVLGGYLLPLHTASSTELRSMIQAAIDEHSVDQPGDILELDSYCELLRELDGRIKSDREMRQWPAWLERLFAFSRFRQCPQLHRAIAVNGELRPHAATAIDVDRLPPANADLLDVMLNADILGTLGAERKSHWRSALEPVHIFVAWELLKRRADLLAAIISLGIAPDLALLADAIGSARSGSFGDAAAARLEAYRNSTPTQLSAAARYGAQGRADHARLLAAVSEHRRDIGANGAIIPYETVAMALDAVVAAP